MSHIISALKFTQAQLKQEQAILRESEELNRLMVNVVQDYAIYLLDPNGYVVSWNQPINLTELIQAIANLTSVPL